MGWNEVSIYVMMDIPDALFDKPYLQATIAIPQSSVQKSPLNAEVADNCREAIESATGLEFSIRVMQPNTDGKN